MVLSYIGSETAQRDNLLMFENNIKHSVAPAIRKFKPCHIVSVYRR